MSVIALFETADGDTVGVRFPDVDAALDWEDKHYGELSGVGRVRIVAKAEVLRLSRSD